MLPRFCKLCYQVVDESIVKFRRFSVRHSNQTSSESFSDEESEYEENFENIARPVEKITEKPKRFCIIKCKRSEFDFYKGDTYPKFEAIPLASRGWQHRKSQDDYFVINPFEPDPEDLIDTSLTFKDVNLDEALLKNIENSGLIYPTSIQKLGIPKLLAGQNAVLTAETGCGKTYAFLIPLLHQILQWKPMTKDRFNKPLGVILTPSHELTLQISSVAKRLAKGLNINITTLTGGKTKRMIHNPPVGEVDLIISSIGVINKLTGTNIYKMNEVRHVVLDEADTLFDETFNDVVRNVLTKIPIGSERIYNQNYPSTAQITLNSATIPQNLEDTLFSIVNPDSFQQVTTGHEHQIKVPQKFWRLLPSKKPIALLKLVKPKAKSKTPVIIFSNTAATCDFTKMFLESFNINCINLHGSMPDKYRRGKFMEFQSGRCSVLATTDAGARGLDTVIAKDVINFDFPLITSEYIHRCGRIGRIGSPKDCRVINFISRHLEIILTNKIEFAIRKMKSIPMVDMIHQNKDEEREFLSSGPSHVTEVKDDGHDISNEDGNSQDAYQIPQ